MASGIDELFRLPLAEFTAARNLLAKSAGKDGAAIRELGKPPLAAWAVNQLYWQDRPTYDTLIDAATDMRRTHKAVIEGKRADLRTAGREHEIALDAALKATLTLLKRSGNPVTEATRQAILNTLRALPSADPPGRLTRTLAPGGFEMLAGVSPAAAPKRAADRTDKASPALARKGSAETDTRGDREAARQREARAAAERAVRDADQKARRAEFEAARAAREAAKADKRLEEARRTLADAQAEFESAEKASRTAEKERDAADRRSADANAALDAARERVPKGSK